MGNSKVIFGNETLIDLTGDTVTPDTLLAGTTAHNRSGEQIVGTVTVPEELDDLTDVDITSAADGDLLQYNSTSQKWENSNAVPQELSAMQEAGAVNLLPNDATSQVINGVTFTVNADKSITISSPNEIESTIEFIVNNKFALNAGSYKVYSPVRLSTPPSSLRIWNGRGGLVWDGSWGDTFNLDASFSTLQFVIRLYAGFVGTVTYKPMIYDARLVNPPYQPFTMTNRELTDVANALGTWEDITSQCGYYHENTAPHATDACQVYVNKLLKLASFHLRFDVNTTALADLGNQTPWMSLPSGYKWKMINDGEGTGNNYHFISIGLARVAASAEFTGNMDATKLSWRISNSGDRPRLILSYGSTGTVKTSYLYTPMFMVPLETVPA